MRTTPISIFAGSWSTSGCRKRAKTSRKGSANQGWDRSPLVWDSYCFIIEDETGQYSLEELRTIQDWLIKFNLQTVPGVTEVLGIGGYEKQYHVVLDPSSLLRYDVTIQELIEQIKANNLNVGAQFIEKNAEEFIVRSVGLASNIDDIDNIIIKSEDGIPST